MYWGHFLWELCGHWSSTPVSGLDRIAGGKIDSPVRSTAVQCLPKSPRGRTKLSLQTQPWFRYNNTSFFLSLCVFRSRCCGFGFREETNCTHVAFLLLGVCVSLLLTFHLASCEPWWTRAWPQRCASPAATLGSRCLPPALNAAHSAHVQSVLAHWQSTACFKQPMETIQHEQNSGRLEFPSVYVFLLEQHHCFEHN